MLDNKSIEKAISRGEIGITVSFIANDDEIKILNSETNILESELKNNLYSDRLKLTMGPIVRVLNKHVKSKCRFKSSKEHYDLRNSNNTYCIKPGESIIILTNERIKLDGKHACLIVPRISLSDVGLVVTTAYIDPYYDGILRLHLTNFSKEVHQIKTLECIAQCFFFELTTESSQKFKDNFAIKSAFYGQTWHGIIKSDMQPFPTKKNSVSEDKFANVKYQINLLWSIVKKYSILSVLFLNIISFICGYSVFKDKFDKYNNSVNQIEEMLTPASSEIIISKGEIYGKKEIFVQFEKSEIISVICNNDELNYKILSSDTKGSTIIVFTAILDSPATEEYTIDFSYSVIRRVKK